MQKTNDCVVLDSGCSSLSDSALTWIQLLDVARILKTSLKKKQSFTTHM